MGERNVNIENIDFMELFSMNVTFFAELIKVNF